jgi:uncharacterized membrane protein YcaP (DUF421 family)
MELVVEIALRTMLIFVWVLLGLRVSGKRHLGQMNVYDLAMIMAVANGVQNAMTRGSGDLRVGLTASSTLFALGWLLNRLSARSARVHDSLAGRAKVLVNHGHLDKNACRVEEVTLGDIDKALRSVGLSRVEQARMIVLEVDGTLSVIPEADSPEGS